MDFVFDIAKSREDKHGIDFEEARTLWKDDNRFEIAGAMEGEERNLVIGKIDGKHWCAVITYRDDRIRLISVRRARDLEIACYEG